MMHIINIQFIIEGRPELSSPKPLQYFPKFSIMRCETITQDYCIIHRRFEQWAVLDFESSFGAQANRYEKTLVEEYPAESHIGPEFEILYRVLWVPPDLSFPSMWNSI